MNTWNPFRRKHLKPGAQYTAKQIAEQLYITQGLDGLSARNVTAAFEAWNGGATLSSSHAHSIIRRLREELGTYDLLFDLRMAHISQDAL